MCARVKNGIFLKHEIDLRSIYDVNPMRMKMSHIFLLKNLLN